MPTALEAMRFKEASFKEALMGSIRPVGNSVAMDLKIQPKDKAPSSLGTVGIKPPAMAKNLGAPTAPMAMAGAK